MADTSFRDLTVGAFVDALASAEPVPGGGSASAVAASLGGALVAMVAGLSQGRMRWAEHAALHVEIAETGRRLAAHLLDLADQDAAAYAGFAAALKLPKETEAEVSTRREAMRAAARHASDVPMETLEACLGVVSAAESLAGRCNTNAASDVGVAALLAEAAAHGAAANVLVNLPSVGDEAYASEMTARVQETLDDIERLAAKAHETIGAGHEREPVRG
ncbi:MAG TPA: cyclodeaminase/cyclohydrolase family protein [Candidatus Limnocylindrales bacterium]|nr:cyclodeaminase/cyclohydrolase family protein [Candidatus Limnocylindrales bacterium]